MRIVAGLASAVLILLVLYDSFETTILPRRVTHRFRFARFYYLSTWRVWRTVGLLIPRHKWREAFLSVFGPLSVLGLLATWVIALIFGFALLHYSLGTAVHSPDSTPAFSTYFYWSGGTFFTLGYGDVTPSTVFGRVMAVAEAGMGFGFLALIIGYLPTFYQTFSKRETMIALLDARAGSPPSAAQLLIRAGRSSVVSSLDPFLGEWERWSAELLESHLSFPVLSYYRSQHENQSWLAALTAILDTCAITIAAVKDHNPFQAQLTFAISRHAAVDLGLVFKAPPVVPKADRLPREKLTKLEADLREAGYELHDSITIQSKLAELRGIYEPFVNALAERFLFALPAIVPEQLKPDNWQTSAWMKRVPGLTSLPLLSKIEDSHFQ